MTSLMFLWKIWCARRIWFFRLFPEPFKSKDDTSVNNMLTFYTINILLVWLADCPQEENCYCKSTRWHVFSCRLSEQIFGIVSTCIILFIYQILPLLFVLLEHINPFPVLDSWRIMMPGENLLKSTFPYKCEMFDFDLFNIV
jgi:hypothetical protein